MKESKAPPEPGRIGCCVIGKDPSIPVGMTLSSAQAYKLNMYGRIRIRPGVDPYRPLQTCFTKIRIFADSRYHRRSRVLIQ